MTLNPLEAISPVDGRYRRVTAVLADYFSEAALIRYRVRVEVEYFIALCRLPLPQLEGFNSHKFDDLRAVYRDFSLSDAQKVKDIEKITNHDVKAVEYFLKEKFDQLGLAAHKEFIHFGLTSQDINNTAMPLALKEAWQGIVRPVLEELISHLVDRARQWKQVPMLARTHGQPPSPTDLETRGHQTQRPGTHGRRMVCRRHPPMMLMRKDGRATGVAFEQGLGLHRPACQPGGADPDVGVCRRHYRPRLPRSPSFRRTIGQ